MRYPTNGIDYTNRDYTAYKQMLIQKLQEEIPEYTDTSETDAGIVIIEGLANGLDILSMYSDVIANDVVLNTTYDRNIAIMLAGNLGYIPYNQSASVIPMVFLLEEEGEEDTLIPRGTVVTTEEGEEEDSDEAVSFETLEDLIIPAGCIGDEKDEDGNYLYTVLAEQGETVDEDYLGSSNGSPNQTFELTFDSVITDSVHIYVDEGEGFIEWKKVDSFLDSEMGDRHYILNVDDFDKCHVQFGNSIRGKIPAVFDNNIMASYRTGGGTIGNVKEGAVTEIESEIGADECFNLAPVTLAHDKETIESIKYNAPAKWRTRDRAITLQDYKDLILSSVWGHEKFFAYDNVIALNSSTDSLGVDIYYQLKPGYSMTNELFAETSSFITERKIIGTSFTINPYIPYPVNIKGALLINKDYTPADVVDEVKKYINDEYFAPGEFTFEDEIVIAELEAEIVASIPGVRSFRVQEPNEAIITAEKSSQIITLGTLTIV